MKYKGNYCKKFVAGVTKRCGINRATVEQVLPAVFDEIRYQLVEGSECVPIESFGTFAVVDVPARSYRCRGKDGQVRVIPIPAKRRLKFSPTRNLRREIEQRKFDPSRRAFTHHPADPYIRTRKNMIYKGSNKNLLLEPVKAVSKE